MGMNAATQVVENLLKEIKLLSQRDKFSATKG